MTMRTKCHRFLGLFTSAPRIILQLVCTSLLFQVIGMANVPFYPTDTEDLINELDRPGELLITDAIEFNWNYS